MSKREKWKKVLFFMFEAAEAAAMVVEEMEILSTFENVYSIRIQSFLLSPHRDPLKAHVKQDFFALKCDVKGVRDDMS
jgi:hypothetical protein